MSFYATVHTQTYTHTPTSTLMQPLPTSLQPPCQPPPLAFPQLPAQNTHGNRSWTPDISSSRCGCWAAGITMGTVGP